MKSIRLPAYATALSFALALPALAISGCAVDTTAPSADNAASSTESALTSIKMLPAKQWSGYFCVTGEECRTADVNGDGRADAIAFNHGNNGGTAAFVGLSNGSAFGSPQEWSGYFCVAGEACAVADVNGDGRADAIAFNHSNNGGTGVWVGLSDGTKFGAPQQWNSYFCVGQEICKTADVNGDGRADLLAFNHGWNGTKVYVALSNGSSFGAPQAWSNYFCVTGETCQVGDVNGDGRADVVAATGTGNVFVALSNGYSFGAPQLWSNWFCISGEDCEIGDVNGDRRADIIAFSHGSASGTGVWVGFSSGYQFAASQKVNDYLCVSNETCAVADVTGDGLADGIAFQRSPANGVWVGVTSY
jgi:hypothetical protein